MPIALVRLNSLFAYVGAPRDGITVLQCVVHDGHHFVERKVVDRAPHPVIGHFDDELRIEGVVCERTDVDIVVDVDRQRGGERLGRVFLALIGESLGHRAEIFVQNGVETPFPSRRERLVRRFGAGLHHCVEVGFQHAREFVEIGFLGAVVEARVGFERDDAVVADAFRHVARGPAFGEVDLAVHADVFHGFLHERMADDPHFGEVHGGASRTQDFPFEERKGRVAPAGAATALILDRGHGDQFDVGEPVAFGGGRVGCLCRSRKCGAEGNEGQQEFLHCFRV